MGTKSGKRRGKKRAGKRSSGRSGGLAMRGIRRFPTTEPVRQHIKLRSISNFTLSGGSPAIVKRWFTNSAWQPEVGGGTGVTPGFPRWSTIYGYYRVMGYQFKVTMMNNEAFSVTCYYINTNADPGTSTNSNLADNRLAADKAINAKGGIDTCTFRSRTISVCQVVGSKSPIYDDTFRGLVTGSPADVTWLGVGVQSISGANLTNGVSCKLELNQFVVFYDPLTQT